MRNFSECSAVVSPKTANGSPMQNPVSIFPYLLVYLPIYPPASPAIYAPILSEAVAAGEGAFNTWIIVSVVSI